MVGESFDDYRDGSRWRGMVGTARAVVREGIWRGGQECKGYSQGFCCEAALNLLACHGIGQPKFEVF